MTTNGKDTLRGQTGGKHPPFDRSLLVEFAQGRLSPAEALVVLDVVEADPELSEDLELVLLMLREGSRGTTGNPIRYDAGSESGPSLRESTPGAVHLLRVAAVLLVMLGAGWILDATTSSPYAHLARVDVADLHLRVRDASTNILQGSRELLYQRAWQECVRRAEWYLAVFPEGEERADACILRSAGLLMGAHGSVLGMHVRYDQAMVDSALAALQMARSGARTIFEAEEIEWFTAKASLMRGDREPARAALQAIIAGGGARVADARALLSSIDAAGQ